jgi:hypothetical protein
MYRIVSPARLQFWRSRGGALVSSQQQTIALLCNDISVNQYCKFTVKMDVTGMFSMNI